MPKPTQAEVADLVGRLRWIAGAAPLRPAPEFGSKDVATEAADALEALAGECAEPVAHRQRLRYAFGDVWAYWDDETSQPMVGDQGPVYVGAVHPLYASQSETRVSMGWVRLDTAGEIIELASDERSGWHEIFRDAYCSCVPSNDGEHGIGCEMHIYAPPSHPAPSEPLCQSCKGSGEMEVMERVEGTADQAWPVTVDCGRCGGTGVAPSEAGAERQEVLSIDEYHEDYGPVLWWMFPVVEPPWCGTPNDSDWPGYHTHWTMLKVPMPPAQPAKGDAS